MSAREALPQLKRNDRPGRARRLIWPTLGGAVFLLAALWFLDPLGALLRYALYFESPMQPVDVVFIGSLGEVETAAKLYHDGMTQVIFINQAPEWKYKDADPPISKHAFIEDELRQRMVPSHAIAHFPYEATDMIESHRRMREWFFENDVKSFMFFPTGYSSAFAKWRHDDTLGRDGIKAVIRPHDGETLWRKQIMALQNLFIQMIWWQWVDLPRLQAEFGYGASSTGE